MSGDYLPVTERSVDSEFKINVEGLTRAVSLLSQSHGSATLASIPERIPEAGIDHELLLDSLAKHVLGGAARLGSETAFAHMDPPPPWITWAMAMWNASLNQNLLHPATAPVAKMVEERVMQWLAPYFGMTGSVLFVPVQGLCQFALFRGINVRRWQRRRELMIATVEKSCGRMSNSKSRF
ncbi:MAG: hypothetical protein ACOYB2_18435 [Limnohabitans sp.]